MVIFSLIFILLHIVVTESRVYCEDPNASPWKSLGYSCPVNCHNIIHTIERLRYLDYNKLLKSDVSLERNQSHVNWANITYTHEVMRRYRVGDVSGQYKMVAKQLLKKYLTILQNKNALQDFRLGFKMADHVHSKCSTLLKMVAIKPIFIKKYTKCARRINSEEDYYLKIFTDVLNKYATKFMFTKEMTKILLQKILGPNTDLRNGLLSLEKIINYLQDALHNLDTDNQKILVRLKSKNCLSLHVSGCFCNAGYVESSGRCVKPSNCSMDDLQMKYLPSIIIY